MPPAADAVQAEIDADQGRAYIFVALS